MKPITDHKKRSRLPEMMACLALGAVLAVATGGSAQADPRHPGPDRDWNRHVVVAHRDWHRGPPPRAIVYAPPVVYAPPPPPESPGLSLVIPMNFR